MSDSSTQRYQFGRSQVAKMLSPLDVSRETFERLHVYARLLRTWQRKINLVSGGTMDAMWTRHFLDSVQLVKLAPNARLWVDVGSGGGFPGLPVAILLMDTAAGALVHLIERDARKCAFLREVARETGAPVEICHGSAEAILPLLRRVDVVTSRAVARLSTLVSWSESLLKSGSMGMFLKGQHVAAELTEAATFSSFVFQALPSPSGSSGFIIKVEQARASNGVQ